MNAREREQSIERLLRQSRPASRQAPAPECPDAQTLAAWVDGGLSDAALEQVQTHLADCARCQHVIATMARSEAGPAVPASPVRRWLPWLVPAAAATIAAAVWVAVPRDAPPSPPQLETAVRQETAPQVAQPPAAPADQPATVSAAPPERATAAATAAPPDVGARVAADNRAQLKEESLAKSQDEQRRDAAQPGAPAVALQAPAAAPPAPPAAPAPPPAAESARTLGAARFALRDAAAVEIVSADSSVRWRVGPTTIEKSSDGGATWEALPANLPAQITAGAAPTGNVCWLVGRAGAVLLSTDGRTWRRVPFPDMTDLSAVRATDALNASVTTAAGRTFSTTDGGMTWTQ